MTSLSPVLHRNGYFAPASWAADNATDLDTSRCRVVAAGPKNLMGYDVRYQYGGNEYVARMDHNPGRRVVIGQDVRDDGTPFDAAIQPTYSWR